MPCEYTPLPHEPGHPAYERQKLDQATRLLCEAYTLIWKHKLEGDISAEGIRWKSEHDKADHERREKERIKQDMERRHRISKAVEAIRNITDEDLDEALRILKEN